MVLKLSSMDPVCNQIIFFFDFLQVLKSLYQRNSLDAEQRCKIVRPCGICSFYNLSQKDTTEIVSQIAKIHDELCDACNLAEEYFTAQMLTTVAVCFLIIVFNT